MPERSVNVRRRIFYQQLGAYLLIVAVAAYGFNRMGNQQEDLGDAQQQITQLVSQMAKQQQCTEQFLSSTVEAASERTSLTPALNAADAERIKSQGKLIAFLVQANQHPESVDAKQYTIVLTDYFEKLQEYLDLLNRQDNKQQLNPYPTKADYRTCLRGGE